MKRLLLVALALLCACGFAFPVFAQQIPVTASLPNYAGSTITATSLATSSHSATGTIATNGAIALTLYAGDFYTFGVTRASSTFPAFSTGRTLVSSQSYFASTDISQALAAGAASVYVAPVVTGGSVTASSVAGAILSQTGCGNAGYVWVPASNTCVAAPSATVPAATSTAAGAVTLAPGATSSTLSMLASTGNVGDAYGGYLTSKALAATNVNLLRNITYTGTGWSYGTGPTFTSFGVNGSGLQSWLVDQPNQWNANFNRRGITQMLGANQYKNAIGDDAFIYAYVMSTGGSRAAADEGLTVLHGQWGDIVSYPQGLVASSSATGITALSINPTTFNSGGTQQFCDGCFLVQKAGGVSGHYTGTPTLVNGTGPQEGGGTTTQALYWTQPVDITVTPSVYGSLLGCPASGGGPIPQSSAPMVYQNDTCTVSAAHGTFATGPITIAGQNLEQATITSVQAVSGSGSGATQQITILHKDKNGVGLTSIFQGGPQGKINMAAWPESVPYLPGGVGQPVGNPVYGAIDAHTLAMGEPHGGAPDMPTTFYDALAIFGLNQSGTSVTAIAVNGFDRTFNTLSGAVVSGCGNALDGTIVGPITESASNLFWTSSTSTSATCANATLSLPPAMTAFTNYPYAEQIAGDTALPVYYPKTAQNDTAGITGTVNPQATGAAMAATRTFTFEANSVPWQNGAQVFEVHPNAQDANALWLFHLNGNPSSINNQNDILLTSKGVQTGRGAWITIADSGPYGYFQGAGGLVLPKLLMSLQGPNRGSTATLPMNGAAIWNYLCPGSDPGCANDQKLWNINNHTIGIWRDSANLLFLPNNTQFGGNVTLAADPATALQPATKQYVDSHSGGTLQPATYYTAGGGGTQNGPSVGTANHIICGGIIIPQGGLSVGHIAFFVGNNDGGSGAISDVGIYGATGTLLGHTGASSFVFNANYTGSFSGTKAIPAGKAFVCYTSTSTSFGLVVQAVGPTVFQTTDIGALATGGVLSSTITAPADNPAGSAYNNSFPQIVLYP